MQNTPTVKSERSPAESVIQSAMIQHGDGVQVGSVGNLNLTSFLITVAKNGDPALNQELLFKFLSQRSREFYNLFVTDDTSFSNGFFVVPLELALMKDIATDVHSKFATLSENAKTQIKTFPSIFINRSENANRLAYYGFVTDIAVQNSGVRIEFTRIDKPFSVSDLTRIYYNLGLNSNPLKNELNKEHWTIKRVDLLQILKAAGVPVYDVA